MTRSGAMDDPNKLIRQEAGNYRTADGRFEVRGQANRWFLVDGEQADELGQELVRGPFATLDEVREAIPATRRAKVKPLAMPKPAQGGKAARARPKPPPLSWIDRLPAGEAARVRALIAALESEGIEKAEQLVRRDRDGPAPEVAQQLIERRLEALLADVPEAEREAARNLVRRAARVLSEDGTRPRRGLPGWTLIEIGPHPAPANRRIRPDA